MLNVVHSLTHYSDLNKDSAATVLSSNAVIKIPKLTKHSTFQNCKDNYITTFKIQYL